MDIENVISLARLQLSEEEKTQFNKQMSSILNYFEELKEVDTNGVKPLVTPIDRNKPFREDNMVKWAEAAQALELAPKKKGNLYQVPPVV